jgi:integrase/recombinase XerD
MSFDHLVAEYIAFKRAKGMTFKTQATALRCFARRLGPLDVAQVEPKLVLAFLYRSKVVTSTWHQRYSTLKGLYRYALARDYVESSPLPTILPKKVEHAQPYIFSAQEIKALLDSSKLLNDETHRRGEISVVTFRTLLLLLYGAGLRLSEALSLTMAEVDLADSLLTIRSSKFFKSRLVPIGEKLTTTLQNYLKVRQESFGRHKSESVLFLNRKGTPLARFTAERYFRYVRQAAGLQRTDGAYFQPPLHDLRSTFAVHRLVTWYRQGADVQRLLPQLSTYLGHVGIAETQVYLKMTPELLREANLRFERYAEVNHAG